jgi:hypothetical protein
LTEKVQYINDWQSISRIEQTEIEYAE